MMPGARRTHRNCAPSIWIETSATGESLVMVQHPGLPAIAWQALPGKGCADTLARALGARGAIEHRAQAAYIRTLH